MKNESNLSAEQQKIALIAGGGPLPAVSRVGRPEAERPTVVEQEEIVRIAGYAAPAAETIAESQVGGYVHAPDPGTLRRFNTGIHPKRKSPR